MPSVKEVHYFDIRFRSNKRARVGRARSFCARAEKGNADRPDYLRKITSPRRMYTDAWYEDIFSIAPAGLKTGEITPSYCAIPEEGIVHINATHPNVRLIYIIRDPLNRMISSLKMAISKNLKLKPGRDVASLVEHALGMPLFLPNGDYASNIPRWDRYFPDILYLPFGRVKTDPHGLLQDVERHIGVTPRADHVNAEKSYRKGAEIKVSEQYIERLRAEAEPQLAYLRERFGPAFCAAI